MRQEASVFYVFDLTENKTVHESSVALNALAWAQYREKLPAFQIIVWDSRGNKHLVAEKNSADEDVRWLM